MLVLKYNNLQNFGKTGSFLGNDWPISSIQLERSPALLTTRLLSIVLKCENKNPVGSSGILCFSAKRLIGFGSVPAFCSSDASFAFLLSTESWVWQNSPPWREPWRRHTEWRQSSRDLPWRSNWKKAKSYHRRTQTATKRINTFTRTHQSDFLHVRIPPFKDGEEELIGSLRFGPFVVELHHRRLEDKPERMKRTPPEPPRVLERVNWQWRKTPLAETPRLRCSSRTSSPKTSWPRSWTRRRKSTWSSSSRSPSWTPTYSH